ncbi:MAG: DrmE family protein [Gammaproteobacteria bacterium]|nr:DrmE family protein [Gammaproteobacteria bacterium]
MEGATWENPSNESLVTQNVWRHYPWLKDLFVSSGNAATGAPFPPFLGALLHTMDRGSLAPSCIVLPAKDGCAFSLALASALHAIWEQFEHVELDQLTTPLKAGIKVKVAPENRVWLVERDGVVLFGERRIALRNPVDDQISYMKESEAFRLTTTESKGPKPKKGSRISPWQASPVDQLLGINTGGNLDVFGTQTVLVAPQQKTQLLADTTVVSGSGRLRPHASELITWGRVKKNGRTVAKDQSVEPIVAVTHSVALMAEACRRFKDDERRVVVNGAAGLAGDSSAFYETSERHKLMILSDHSELDEVRLLQDRGCEVWAPDPETVLPLLGNVDQLASPVTRTHIMIRNCRDLAVVPIMVSDEKIEKLHDLIDEAWSRRPSEDMARLNSLTWRVLLLATEWVGAPNKATLDAFETVVRTLQSTIRAERAWMRASVRNALERALDIATDLLAIRESGVDKGNALLAHLEEESDTAIVARNTVAKNQVGWFLDTADIECPVYLPYKMSHETYDSIVLCSWPGRSRMSRIVAQYPSRRIAVLCYPFEERWLSLYANRWIKEWKRFRRPVREITRMTGLNGWSTAKEFDRPKSVPRVQDGDRHRTDPVSSLLASRKKTSHEKVEHYQVREARYVGFEGDGYSYLTDAHKVPLLTDLILGYRPDVHRIPLVSAKELVVGDFVLFRERGDRDMIAAVAEQEIGTGAYASLRNLAKRWRPAVASLGHNFEDIYTVLRRAGLRRQPATVRTWLYDDDRIGPQDKADLETIARASGRKQLLGGLEDTWNAIVRLRTEHRQAGSTLSRLLLSELPSYIETTLSTPCRIKLTLGNAWVVEVEEVAAAMESRPQWEVNSFLLDDEH